VIVTDRFNPIGEAEWNDPVGIHETRFGDDPVRLEMIRSRGFWRSWVDLALLEWFDRRRRYARADHGRGLRAT
jgi:hypothetical protein